MGAQRLSQALGLARSLAIYYGQPWRSRSLSRLYRRFVQPGDLVFDVGAHVGNHTRRFTRLGARVVAVEPQAELVAWLRFQFRNEPGVTVLDCALAAEPGKARMYASPRTPTVTTLSRDWIEEVRAAESFARVRWQEAAEVPTTTLDALIARYGLPRFCKIDVEGFEAETLRGLSQPLPALSFEFVPAAHEIAIEALRLLERLAAYRYNLSLGEDHRFLWPEWRDAGAVSGWLAAGEARGRSGDVYARFDVGEPRQSS
jgi:FkbM family methyltransferase